MISGVVELRNIAEVVTSTGSLQCRFEDGTTAEAPGILARFLQRRDQLRFLGASTEILIQHPTGRRHQQLLHATIGYVGLPKPDKNGEEGSVLSTDWVPFGDGQALVVEVTDVPDDLGDLLAVTIARAKSTRVPTASFSTCAATAAARPTARTPRSGFFCRAHASSP